MEICLIVFLGVIFIAANLIMNPPQAWCDWVGNWISEDEKTHNRKNN